MSDEITHGRVVDITIDPVAGPSIPDNIAMLAPCGILILYGALDGKVQFDLQPTLRFAGMRNVIDMLAAGKLHPRIYARAPLGGERMKCWRAVW